MHIAQHYVIFSIILVISSFSAPNIFLSTLFSNTLNLCASLKVRDQVSQTYNTTDSIIVLYVLTFNFFESRRDDIIFSNECHAFPIFISSLISSRMSFVFVTVTPRYLNFSTFSNNKFSISLLYFDFVLHFAGGM